MIRTTCPQCGREDAIADYLASLPVMCKSCGHRVTMGEPIAPPKPVLSPPAPPPPPKPAPPPPPKPVPPPPPPPVVAASPPPIPSVKPAPPSDSAVSLGDKPQSQADQPTYPLSPRAAFLQATGPGMVDLFEDVPVVESRTERPPLPPPPAPLSPPSAPSLLRGRRFAARLVTLLGVALALFAGVMLAGFAPNVVKNDKLMSTLFLFTPLALYALYNVVLLGKHGQDFGKRALKLRIVRDDGTPAKFAQAFLKRELVVILLLTGIIPLAWMLYQSQTNGQLAGQWERMGGKMFLPNVTPEVMPALAAVLFSLMNAVMIFNKDGKCIHDRLAKTTVTREG